MKALILLAGPLSPTPGLLREAEEAELVVAADGGIRHAEALGRLPDLWMGDFDSSSPALLARYSDLQRERHPRDKDATDAELAARAAIRRGARALLFAGALGGEPDHVLAHYALSLGLAGEGLEIALTDGRHWAWPLVPPGRRVALPPGTPFSLIPLAPLEGLTLTGARWTLAGAHLPLGSTRATRNEAAGPVEVSLRRGQGVLIARPEVS